MQRTILFILPREFKGENQGLYVQHVESMEWLLQASEWNIRSAHLRHPELNAVALAADVVVIHMLANSDAEAIIRARRAAGLLTVFEISDNFLDLGPWLPARHPLRSPLIRQNVLYHAWLCDAMQVYAPPLAQLFAAVNERIGVFDPYVPLSESKRASLEGPLVVGWAGTTSHADGLARIAPAIAAFCERHDDILFAYMGNEQLFHTHFGRLNPARTRVRSFGSYEQYLDFVKGWDVGLAPLGGSGFNRTRTDTKFATYAACHVAPLLEKHPVHEPHREHAMIFDDADSLGVILDQLAEDRTRAHVLAARAHAWAERERNKDRLRAQRIGFYESLAAETAPKFLGKSGGVTPQDVLPPSPLERLRGSHRSWTNRIDYFRAVLEHQPYDYIALRNVIEHQERSGGANGELACYYERLCFLAPEDVPQQWKPAGLRRFLPDAA